MLFAKGLSGSLNPLVAVVQVGTAPVSLVFVNEGRHIITAESNKFSYANATTSLTVLETEAALKGKQGFHRIPHGLFPREFGIRPDGKTLLVSEQSSKAVQHMNISRLISHKHVYYRRNKVVRTDLNAVFETLDTSNLLLGQKFEGRSIKFAYLLLGSICIWVLLDIHLLEMPLNSHCRNI